MFIMLKKSGRVRGTAAILKTSWPMWKAVIELMTIAAFTDPKHKALVADDVENIKIEIYLMEDPVMVSAEDNSGFLKEIEIGTDGVIVDFDGKTEALLPSVAKDCARHKKDFMDCVCKKMEFGSDTWKEEECRIWKFRVEKLVE